MENKLDAILKEIKSNKSASTVTNPRSEIIDTQNMQPSDPKLTSLLEYTHLTMKIETQKMRIILLKPLKWKTLDIHPNHFTETIQI